MRTVRMKPGVGAPLRMQVAGNAHRGLLQADLPPASKHLNPISLFAVISRSCPSPYLGDRELSHIA